MNKHKKSRHRMRRGRDREEIEEGIELWEDLLGIEREIDSDFKEAQSGTDPSQSGQPSSASSDLPT